MEVKEMMREISDAERLAERGRMVLELNEKLLTAQARIKELETELKAKKTAKAGG